MIDWSWFVYICMKSLKAGNLWLKFSFERVLRQSLKKRAKRWGSHKIGLPKKDHRTSSTPTGFCPPPDFFLSESFPFHVEKIFRVYDTFKSWLRPSEWCCIQFHVIKLYDVHYFRYNWHQFGIVTSEIAGQYLYQAFGSVTIYPADSKSNLYIRNIENLRLKPGSQYIISIVIL